tara:strand:+ start:53 stop:358 length:306 start_codon:yes stop_codon:yes gene_type:complete
MYAEELRQAKEALPGRVCSRGRDTMKPAITKEVIEFVNYYVNTVLDSRKKDLRAQSDAEDDPQMRVVLTQKLIEVIEISISMRDMLYPTRITNNDEEDDGN